MNDQHQLQFSMVKWSYTFLPKSLPSRSKLATFHQACKSGYLLQVSSLWVLTSQLSLSLASSTECTNTPPPNTTLLPPTQSKINSQVFIVSSFSFLFSSSMLLLALSDAVFLFMLVQDVSILVFSVCYINQFAIPTASLRRFPFLLCVKIYLYALAWFFTLPLIFCAL